MRTIIKLLPALVIVFCSLPAYTQNQSTLKSKKVLIVVTNTSVAPSNGAAIGLWLEEFASPYYMLKDKGVQITIASPNGDVSPVDLRSVAEQASSEYTKRFLADTAAQKELYHTVALKDINPEHYDAVFYPGGRGPMWDMPENQYSIRIIESLYASGKPISFVCHGPVALRHAKKDGILIIKGKRVAGFTNTEEEAGNTSGGVPYSLEDMLKSLGAIYKKGENFKPFVLTDGILITGQNPHSSVMVAEELMEALIRKRNE